MNQAEDAAIEAGWRYFLREDMDVPFARIVELARNRCPGVEVACIRAEFDRRLRARCGLAERPAEVPEAARKGAGVPLNVGSADVPAHIGGRIAERVGVQSRF